MEINNLKKLNLTSNDNNIDEVDFVERQPDTEGPKQKQLTQPTEFDIEEEFENHEGDDNEASGSQPKGFVAGEPLKCYDVNNYFRFRYTCIG